MSTELIISPEPVIPELGQLLYNEYQNTETGQFSSAQMFFVDTPIEEGKMWNYTQAAQVEDFGQGIEAYVGDEAGAMPATVTRVATDDDIRKVIDLVVGENEENVKKVSEWLLRLNKDEILQDTEKQRISRLAEAHLLEKFGEQAVQLLKQDLQN